MWKAFAFLLAATMAEATGDALIRLGLGEHPWRRAVLFVAGAGLLFSYGLSLNLAPIEFRRVVGLYIATLFVVWQVVNFLFFRTMPTPLVVLGGAMIVVGGLIVSFWGQPAAD